MLGTTHGSTRRLALLAWTMTATAIVGCDSGSAAAEAERKQAEAAAAEEAEREARLAKIRAEREAEEKAAEEAEQRKQEQIAALAVLPDKYPKKLDKACAAVGEAQNAYMERAFADEEETLQKWKSAAGTQVPMLVTNCKKTGSLEVAACQINALEKAPSELVKDFPMLLRACADKFGEQEPGGAVPPT